MALHFIDESVTAVAGDTIALAGAEAHHAAAVRRVRPGETVTITDGRGAWIEGEVLSVDPSRVEIRVVRRENIARPTPRIQLAQGLAKGDRDELAVQAATELGVDAIVPWQAARSVSRWQGAKAEKGRARWQRIAREAAKQAHRAWIPEVDDVVTTAKLAARTQDADVVVLDPRAELPLTRAEPSHDRDLLIVVGPEGGIAPEELHALISAGARAAQLGDTVLRTSTAGPAALAVLNAVSGRW
ncbi:ribosomal RNA small subunit methyltransferase E [Microbacterium faecale]|uniref:Ribosomal RNA small subunit methyltransferase E n=1 Tax=Microbacterium faecale TaxID=1804630 RepID=A0A917DIM5_9MICO|nr:16S rRNA (uracil(1498)-N(3))-methyltransferase [Microbacterium faecale]GGD39355.1 ribosomal RNA small subunit methyltransferase E [Microbacterium faecale]